MMAGMPPVAIRVLDWSALDVQHRLRRFSYMPRVWAIA